MPRPVHRTAMPWSSIALALLFSLARPGPAHAMTHAWDDSTCNTGGSWFEPTCWNGPGIPDHPDHSVSIDLDQPESIITIPTTANLGIQLNGLFCTETIQLEISDNMYLNMVRSSSNQDPVISIDYRMNLDSNVLGSSRLRLVDSPEGSPVLQIIGVGEIDLGRNAGIETGANGRIDVGGGIEIYGLGSDVKPASINGNLRNLGGEIVAVSGILTLGGDIQNLNGGFAEIDDQFQSGNVRMVVTGTLRGGTVYPGNGTLKLQGGELAGIAVAPGTVEVVFGGRLGGLVSLSGGTEVLVAQLQTLDIGGHPEEGAPVLANDGIIRLGNPTVGATFRCDGSIVELLGNGTLSMEGPGAKLITTGGGIFRNGPDHTIQGQGFVQATVQNQGLVVVEGGTLTNFATINDLGGSVVVLGDPGTPATLSISALFATHDLTVTEFGRMNVGAGWYADVSGDWINRSQDETALTWGASTTLILSGAGPAQAFEATSEDRGAVNAGFSTNFAFPRVLLTMAGTYVYLRDLHDNGNRNGSNGSHEAVYTELLEVQPGTTLNLNGICLYTRLGGQPYRVAAGDGALFGGGTIVDTIGTAVDRPIDPLPLRALQVSPNPFNPRATISFELTEPASVTLDVFDLRGRLVETLLERVPMVAGPRTVEWDATALASGHYRVRLRVGAVETTKGATLIK